jgi:integrase
MSEDPSRKLKLPLSYHKGKRRWYKYLDGKLKYFGPGAPRGQKPSFDVAYAEYLKWKEEQENPIAGIEMSDDGSRIYAVKLKEGADQQRILTDSAFFFDRLAKTITFADNLPPKERTQQIASALEWAVDHIKVEQAERERQAKPDSVTTGPRLSEVRDFWERVAKPKADYRSKTTGHFKGFIDILGDMPLSALKRDHLALYTRQLEATGKTAPNRQHCFTSVKLVLNFLGKPKAQRAEDYPRFESALPPNLADMLKLLNVDADELPPTDSHHAEPFPPADFRAITAAAEKAGNQQFVALWKLAAQAGYNMSDFGRLVWGESVVLDDAIPHVRLARVKKGKGKRCHPLAPQTIQALKSYRESLPSAKAADGVCAFLNIHGESTCNRPMDRHAISDDFEDYRKAAGVGKEWSFKHVRNIGPNVRVALKLPIDEEWAFLGQTRKLGEAQKYEFQEPHRLKKLVTAIAKRYL